MRFKMKIMNGGKYEINEEERNYENGGDGKDLKCFNRKGSKKDQDKRRREDGEKENNEYDRKYLEKYKIGRDG